MSEACNNSLHKTFYVGRHLDCSACIVEERDRLRAALAEANKEIGEFYEARARNEVRFSELKAELAAVRARVFDLEQALNAEYAADEVISGICEAKESRIRELESELSQYRQGAGSY